MGLVAEDAEGHQDEVDVALGEDLAEDPLVGLGVQRVEGDGVHLGAQGAQVLLSLIHISRAGAAGDQPTGGGERDLGRAAEDEQGLGEAEGVLHDGSLRG